MRFTTHDEYVNRNDLLNTLEKSNMSVKGIRLGLGKIFLVEYSEKLREHYADIIRGVPAANVVPDVYGVWVEVGKTSKGTPIRRCSCCGVEKAGRAKTNYCPDCGCRMIRDEPIEGQQVLLI